MALALCGCSEPTQPEPVQPEPSPVVEPTVITRAAPKPPSDGQAGGALRITGGDAVPIQFKFFGVGHLHQGYFAARPVAAELGRGLASCTEHTFEMHITYIDKVQGGRIIGVVPPDSLSCAPTVRDGVVDLSPLEPMGKALAKYRDTLSGLYDIRIQNFKVGLDFSRELKSCRIMLKGQHPPDGSTWSPCVEFMGQNHCAQMAPDASGVTRLAFDDARVGRDVAVCFGGT